MLANRQRADGATPALAGERSPPTDPARIASWVQPQNILLEVAASRREDVLRAAADAIGGSNALSPDLIHDALWRREQAGSTALAHGFAIPHARIPGIARPLTVYLRAGTPVSFGASDGIPSSHFLVVMVPTDGAADDHLQLLAIVARLFSDRRFRRQIGKAADAIAAADVFRAGIERVRAS